MLISLLLSVALAQEAEAPPAPPAAQAAPPATAPLSVITYQHFAYIIETPQNCARAGKRGWCLLAESARNPGAWTTSVGADGEPLLFPTQAAAMDYLSQSGWEIWNLQVNGLKSAVRVDMRRPVGVVATDSQ